MEVSEKYRQLIVKICPKIVRTEAENEAYLQKIEELMSKKSLNVEEEDLLETLAILSADFEAKHYAVAVARPAPLEILQHLMEANSLAPKDLIDVFGSENVASLVYQGTCVLTVEHIRKLAKRFNISPAV